MRKEIYGIALSVFFIFYAVHSSAQRINNYPQNYFGNPLNIPMQLAANFGEIRPDHFHMGLDIRTQSKENLAVYASAEGYISHIRIERYGYGRAIFITHPNGYTTLYAHLNNFYDTLEKYIKNKEYKDEKWQQDFSIPKGMFTVKKGQFIAYSGNTGASQGPHLHFEIRDTKTGNNLNPLLFGFDIPDTIPPVIYSLYWYDRRYSIYSVTSQNIALNKKDKNLSARDPIVQVSSPIISLGIRIEDRNSTSPFRYGVYHAALHIDDSLLFEFYMDNFLYADSRYVNACIDYSKWISSKAGIQHLAILPGNQLDIFSDIDSDGKIILNDTAVHTVQITISDENENTSTINFLLQFKDSLKKKYSFDTSAIICLPGEEIKIETAHASLQFDKNAFYDALPFTITETKSEAVNQVSPTIRMSSYLIPVHNDYNIALQSNVGLSDSIKNKTIIQLKSGNSYQLVKGTWQNNRMLANFDELGEARLLIDTIAPVIAQVGWKNSSMFTGNKNLIVKCTDNLGRIKNFRAELDGNWLMFSEKDNFFIYTFDEHCAEGPHQLNITATDIASNTITKTFTFTKQ